jgi:hypothetical protein
MKGPRRLLVKARTKNTMSTVTKDWLGTLVRPPVCVAEATSRGGSEALFHDVDAAAAAAADAVVIAVVRLANKNRRLALVLPPLYQC